MAGLLASTGSDELQPTVRAVAASCYDRCDDVRPRRGELPTAGSALAHFPFFFRFLDFFSKKKLLSSFFSKFLS
jgi:hypothetical protein